jgi:glycosyltransferase involved in cell wall biosynthesis
LAEGNGRDPQVILQFLLLTMHILLIHQAFAALDEPGGTRHHEFARHLAAQGHRVTVITSPVSYLTGNSAPSNPPASTGKWGRRRQRAGPEMVTGVTILRATTDRPLHRSFVQRVFAFISFMTASFFIGLGVRNVDLVWGTSPPIFQGLTAWLLARLKRIPFLFEVRDLWPDFAIAVGVLRNRVLIRLSLWLEYFLYRHADRVMVNSPGFVTHVMEGGAGRVELVPNGADPEMFDPCNDGLSFRSAHQLEDKFVLLYAGAHGLSNDLGVVLECARLLADTPQIQIVLLGDGKEKTALHQQASAMGLTNLLFLAPVPKTDIPAVLAGADACLAILKPIQAYQTTYPNKVFDYMAAGRPVVLAIDGVIRAVVEAAGCGVFAQPGNPPALAAAIQALSADKSAAREMGLRGRRYVEEHFSRAASANKLAGVLKEMVAGR